MLDVVQNALAYHSRLKDELTKIENFLRMADRLYGLDPTQTRSAPAAEAAKPAAPAPQMAAPQMAAPPAAPQMATPEHQQIPPAQPKEEPALSKVDPDSDEAPVVVEPWDRNGSGTGARRGLSFRGYFDDGPSELDRQKIVA